MTPYVAERIDFSQALRQASEALILRIGIRDIVGSLELNADREVVALFFAIEARYSSVPGSFIARYELSHMARAIN